MNGLFIRQAAVLRQLVSDYKCGNIGLDALIQKIEGIGDVVNIEKWKDAIFPIILSMEQINAAAIEERRRLTAAEVSTIDKFLHEVETLSNRLETGKL
jgi:hypothetical protein